MDPRLSPYAPGAGTRPPALAGREAELERFSILLDRLADGRSAEALLFAGSRGMGKTVLLRECERRARSAGWFTAFEEVHRDLALRDLMALCARDVLLQMSASKRFGARIRNALGVLKAFTSVGAFGDAAIAQAVDFAEGSPYVLQLLGEEAWAGAEGPRIGSGDVRSAIGRVTERLDGEFYPRLVYEVGPSGIAVIAAFARAAQAAVSAAELAPASGQPLHEVYRILHALERRDLVHRAHVAGDRRPGYALATRGLGAYVERAGLVEAPSGRQPPRPQPGG